jgi:protein-tyrosine-phosphatase/DNA-binding transcriptional ArsR family regulator
VGVKTTDLSPGEFLQLVADPQRWRVLSELARSDRRVGELTELVGKPQNLVSYHVGQLRDAGLINARQSAADRRDTYYQVDLARCGELLADAGRTLHPGLRLALVPAPPALERRRSRGGRPRVLFLCTGNSARSQIAAALLEQRSNHTIEARSAGSHPKPLHPNAVRVLAERGIDIAGRTSTHFDRFARTRFDRVITLCDKVKEICPEFPGRPLTAHWSIPDPASTADDADASYPAFVRTADGIDRRLGFLIAELQPSTAREERT